MIDAVPEPASTLIAAAAFAGARRGQLRGMFRENYSEGELLIALDLEWDYDQPKKRHEQGSDPNHSETGHQTRGASHISRKAKGGTDFSQRSRQGD